MRVSSAMEVRERWRGRQHRRQLRQGLRQRGQRGATRLDGTITEASARQAGVQQRGAAAVAVRRGSMYVAQRRHGGGSGGTATALRESEGHIASDLRDLSRAQLNLTSFRRATFPSFAENRGLENRNCSGAPVMEAACGTRCCATITTATHYYTPRPRHERDVWLEKVVLLHGSRITAPTTAARAAHCRAAPHQTAGAAGCPHESAHRVGRRGRRSACCSRKPTGCTPASPLFRDLGAAPVVPMASPVPEPTV